MILHLPLVYLIDCSTIILDFYSKKFKGEEEKKLFVLSQKKVLQTFNQSFLVDDIRLHHQSDNADKSEFFVADFINKFFCCEN